MQRKTAPRKATNRAATPSRPAEGKAAHPQAKSPPAVKSGPAIAVPDNTGNGRARFLAQQFKPGQSGNPAGRPKSARSKVSERFLSDLHETWQQCGPAVLKRLAEEKPADLVRAVVAVLPKEVDLHVSQYDSMSDDQLRAQLRAALREAAELGIDLGTLHDESVH